MYGCPDKVILQILYRRHGIYFKLTAKVNFELPKIGPSLFLSLNIGPNFENDVIRILL